MDRESVERNLPTQTDDRKTLVALATELGEHEVLMLSVGVSCDTADTWQRIVQPISNARQSYRKSTNE